MMATQRGQARDPHDRALFREMASRLYVSVLADILDRLDRRNQVLDAAVRPLVNTSAATVVGRAAPMAFAPCEKAHDDPYRTQIEAIDALQAGEVAVLASNGVRSCALWGELFSTAATARGVRGMVADGYHRDTEMIERIGFPIYSLGSLPRDISGRARVSEFGRPVVCAGVLISPGDIVFAEKDGVVAIPADVADATLELAFEKVSRENSAREELRSGDTLAAVWQRHRVL
jgi:4-hydroxy-4-methyl-2-oxoglutarate aldolase